MEKNIGSIKYSIGSTIGKPLLSIQNGTLARDLTITSPAAVWEGEKGTTVLSNIRK